MNVFDSFYKNAEENTYVSWKLYHVSYVNKLGMFQNDMMSYDSTLFHGTLTNWGHEKNWVKTSWSVLSKHPDMMFTYLAMFCQCSELLWAAQIS